jgi:AAA domain
MRREFTRQGLGYVMTIPDIATELSVRYVRRSRGDTVGELTVTCAQPFTRSADGHLHQANLNISGTDARKRLATVLRERSNLDAVDWVDVLEDFCRRVLAAERTGKPLVKVGAKPVAAKGETYRLDPLLPINQTAILFGDGGTGKSTLAAAIAVAVEYGVAVIKGWAPRRAPALYLDWEAGEESLNRRVWAVGRGAHIPGQVEITYRDCRQMGPLHTFAESVAAEVDQHGFGLVVVDSAGMAGGLGSDGGDANESSLRLFQAIGFLGTTVLVIDHVNKVDADDERRTARPYGSIYKSNLARATWELRRKKSDAGSYLGLYNPKNNDDDTVAPVSLQVFHDDDGAIRYERMATMPVELTKNLGQREQLIAALQQYGHMNVDELATETGLKPEQVRAVLSRNGAHFNKLQSGKWEAIGAT